MLNYLWGFMLLIGIAYGAFAGNLPALTDAALNSAKEAVTLCITMLGVMSFWMGLMRIAERAGIIGGATRRMKPLLRFLFPNIPAGHPSLEHIATNMIANVFGLGWAATPAGLKAMEELAKLEEERRCSASGKSAINHRARNQDAVGGAARHRPMGKRRPRRGGKMHAMPPEVASNEMCTFLIINISSLQLIPVNIIAYRSQYGSVSPAAVVGPAIVATMVSTGVAVAYCKWKDRERG